MDTYKMRIELMNSKDADCLTNAFKEKGYKDKELEDVKRIELLLDELFVQEKIHNLTQK